MEKLLSSFLLNVCYLFCQFLKYSKLKILHIINDNNNKNICSIEYQLSEIYNDSGSPINIQLSK